ncbi:hypothetical protein Taro_014126 [Colocasia esculenta]|uniref:Uncharacterized protein n=1 Tax=Colocasia esculenta TaxID=4460 RepID=A0A843UIH8_COLES|nr:hypothetical protein [Colocasia esculenta]
MVVDAYRGYLSSWVPQCVVSLVRLRPVRGRRTRFKYVTGLTGLDEAYRHSWYQRKAVVMAGRRDWGGGGDDPEESTQRMIEMIWESLTEIQMRMDQQAPVPPVTEEAVPVAPVPPPPGVEVPFVAPFPTEPVTSEAHPYSPQEWARRRFLYRRPVRSRVIAVLAQRLQQCSFSFFSCTCCTSGHNFTKLKESTRAWGIPRGTTEENKQLTTPHYTAAGYIVGGTDPAPLRRGFELDDSRETSSSLSPVGVGVSLASHWLSRELPQHRAKPNHRYESSKQYQQFIEQLSRI